MAKPYVHLHLHSHYSILDGVCRISPLMERAKELGYTEMALTDHGSMFGVIDFYQNAEHAGIKPILGMEAYIAPRSRHDKDKQAGDDRAYHLTLLAKDHKGYQNLSRLCSVGHEEGYYYAPRVDKEVLREYGEGLIALSGCLKGEVSQHCLYNRPEEAEKAAREYREIFGEENFFLEIMNNGIEEQIQILEPMRALSKKLEIPLVATSDVHYIKKEHARVQDVLLCIQTGRKVDDENRMRMSTDDFYLKSPEEMYGVFRGFEEACERTAEIAQRCNVVFEDEYALGGVFHLPTIECPDGLSPEAYMDRLCQEGLRKRYGDPLQVAVTERYQKEYGVITTMGFPSYFLMVWDLVNFARKNDIPVGPGRGSAAGSIIAYSLGITNIDPLKYDLLFERFLNEGRNEMPDIDLDFDKERRHEVVDHIIHTHGEDHCAKIVTFSQLSGRSAVRDVARVLGVPLDKSDIVAKMVPEMIKAKDGKSTIDIAMEMNPDLRDLYAQDNEVREVLDIASQLDGVNRHTGIHAAGVLVTDRPITDYGPLAHNKDGISTQFEMKTLETMGLCKVDCLGLETLTLLRKAVDNIKQTTGEEIDLDALPLDDAKTYKMLSRGESKGVFQFESDGFRELLTSLQPDRFSDLIAAVAMYRPGPLGAGLVKDYIDCKHGRKDPNYLHPALEPILNETQGLILYQEQVQALAQQLAGFSLSEGDKMRRAMGKKKKDLMAKYRAQFIEGAQNTIGAKVAEDVFEQIEYFAGYGFNKSHSACYALIAYQTAYLKCHYPREYMAAMLTIKRGETSKVVFYTQEAERMGISVLPPDINESDAHFNVVGENIRFGLAAVKGVGDRAVQGMVEARGEGGSFRDLWDFCERIDLQLLNKGAIEALIKAGAFDSLGGKRAQYIVSLEKAMSAGSAAQKSAANGQMGLFGGGEPAPAPKLPDVPEWPDQTKLQWEKEVLGFYVSSHPLAAFEEMRRTFATASMAELKEVPDRAAVTVAGLVAEIRHATDKKDRRYARLRLEDMYGSVTVMVFNSVYKEVSHLLNEDEILFVVGKVDNRRDEPSLIADEVVPLSDVQTRLTRQAVIRVTAATLDEGRLDDLKGVLAKHKGTIPVFLEVKSRNGKRVVIQAGPAYKVQPSGQLASDVAGCLGDGHLHYCA